MAEQDDPFEAWLRAGGDPALYSSPDQPATSAPDPAPAPAPAPVVAEPPAPPSQPPQIRLGPISAPEPQAAALPPPEASAPVQTAALPPPAAPAPPPVAAPPVAAPQPPAGQAEDRQTNPTKLFPTSSPEALADYDRRVVTMESGGDPNARNKQPGSTSAGLFGMTDDTFNGLLRLHPELRGKDKNDPAVQDALTMDNAAFLRDRLGKEPNAVDLYAAHFLGAHGGARFLEALGKDPNTLAINVVDTAAVEKNRNAFIDPKTNQPYTVGELYSRVATRMGMPGGAPIAPGGPSPTQAASNSLLPGFPSVKDAFASQQAGLDAYLKSQPAMWAKLQAMQDDYLQKAQPTQSEKMSNLLSQFGMMMSPAMANMAATQGGVLLHANPNPQPFTDAMKANYDANRQDQQQRQDLLKTSYGMKSGLVQAQQAQGLQNLGLSTSMTNAMISYGFDAAKVQIELAKYGQQQIAAFNDFLDKNIPNTETRNKVFAQFIANGGNSSAPLAQNMATLSNLATQAQKGGLQLSAKEPAQMYEGSWTDPNGQTQRVTVNAVTPEGQRQMQELRTAHPNMAWNNLAAPQTNVNVGGEGGGKGEGGAGFQGTLADQQSRAIQTAQAARAALALLPFIEAHGGSGVLTDSPEAKSVLSAIKQATGIDYTGQEVREVYDKLMQQVQLGLVLPEMKQMGARPAQTEFQALMAGQLGATATVKAARAFLMHTAAKADWTQRKVESLADAQREAQIANNKAFDPIYWQVGWNKAPGNLPPVWDGAGLIDAVTKGGTQQNPPVTPNSAVVQTGSDFWKWLRGFSPHTPSAPPTATPIPPGGMPLTDEERARLNGGH